MKKILLLRSAPFDANIKGYNVQEMGLAKALCHLGYDVDWVTFKSRDCNTFTFAEENGHKAVCIEVPRVRIFRWGVNLNYCKKSFLEKYDVFLCFEQMQLMNFLVARHIKKGILYSGPYYNLFTFKFVEPLYDIITTRTMEKVFRGNFTKSVLAQAYLERKGYHNVKSIGVGLDIERFDVDVPIKKETANLVDFMVKHKCLLYVGALSERKNYPFLLEIYKNVYQTDPNVKFVIIGKSVINPWQKFIGKKDEDYAEKCEKVLSSQEREGIVHISKIDNDQLKYIYPLAKAFLLPSKLEIFGMVLLEAMYLGAPVVTSKNGGSMTLIEGKDTGLMIDNFDKDEWVNAILKYLNDSEYSRRIAENARKLIKEKFNWTCIAQQMLKSVE